MKEVIETIVKTLADERDLVSVSKINGINASILDLKVAKSDIGRVNGKQSLTADTLQTMLSKASAKSKKTNHS